MPGVRRLCAPIPPDGAPSSGNCLLEHPSSTSGGPDPHACPVGTPLHVSPGGGGSGLQLRVQRGGTGGALVGQSLAAGVGDARGHINTALGTLHPCACYGTPHAISNQSRSHTTGRQENCSAGGGGVTRKPIPPPPASLAAVTGGGVQGGGAQPAVPGGGGQPNIYGSK